MFLSLIGLALACYVIGGVVVDGVAVAKRQTPPSLQKARDRHERKMARGEPSNPSPSYFGRVLGNAAERWATRSDQKHRDKMAWLDERDPHRSNRRLNRKRRNAERYEQAAQTIADKTGVLWGKTKDAAEAARERRAEREAHRRNATERDLPPEGVSDWVATENGWHLPIEYDADGNAWARHPDGTFSRFDEPTLEQQDWVDEQVPDAKVLEFVRPDRPATGTDSPGRNSQTDYELTEQQAELVRLWRHSNELGKSVEVPSEAWRTLPAELRAQLIDESIRAGADPHCFPDGQHPVSLAELDTEAAQYMHETVPGMGVDQPEHPTRARAPRVPLSTNTSAPEPVFDSTLLHPRVRWAYENLDGDQLREHLAELAGEQHWRGTGITAEELATRADAHLPDDPRHPEVAEILDTEPDMEEDYRTQLATILGIDRPLPDEPDPEGYWNSLDDLAARATRVIDAGASSEQELLRSAPEQPEPTTGQPAQGATMTVSPEITNLTSAQAYTSGMQNYLSQVHSGTETNTAEIKRQAEDIAAERANAEVAASSARGQGMEGEHVAALDRAAEGLAQLQDQLEQAAATLEGLPDVVQAAHAQFAQAHQAFEEQSGLAEQVQAANASGNSAADNTAFYANA